MRTYAVSVLGLVGALTMLAGRLLAQGVDVIVSPAAQTVNVDEDVSVQIRLNTNGLGVCHGGVFLQFDPGLLSFVGGMNDTSSGTWSRSIFDVEPAQQRDGNISYA